jgi:hypothetical protein
MAKPVLSNLDFQNTSKIVNHPAGAATGELVTFEQLNAAVEGLQDKGVSVVATQANLNLAAPGATIDGVTMAVNDAFLVRAQTAPAENGLYIYNGAAVAATRSPKMNLSTEFNNAIVLVAGGTSAGVTYRQTALNPTVGTTAIAFIVFGGAVSAASETAAGIIEIATQGETDTGTDNTRAITPQKLANYSGLLKKFSSTFGDGSATQYDITHNLNSTDVNVEVYVVATGDTVMCDVKRQSVNVARLNFSVAPALNSLRCTVVK